MILSLQPYNVLEKKEGFLMRGYMGKLLTVTRAAGGNKIIRCVAPALRQGDDVIHCKLFGLSFAISAPIIIGSFNLFPLRSGKVISRGGCLSCPSPFLGKVSNFRMFFDVRRLPFRQFHAMALTITSHFSKFHFVAVFGRFPQFISRVTAGLHPVTIRTLSRARSLPSMKQSPYLSLVLLSTARANAKGQSGFR